MRPERLALGTVQFGVPYGIANRTGLVPPREARRILNCALQSGVDTLDTAAAYGESEMVLGEIGVEQWRVVTKLPASMKIDEDVRRTVRAALTASLERLRLDKITALLLHRPMQLMEPHGAALYDALVELREEGVVERIGLSVYGPDELEALWAQYPVDLVQAPFNLLDRRLVVSGWLDHLQREGVEVHARSIFLQGLLLMPPKSRPAFFRRWDDVWERFDEWLSREGVSPVEACLGFASARPEISRLVVGVDRLEHLQSLLAMTPSGAAAPDELAVDDLDLINPSRWQGR